MASEGPCRKCVTNFGKIIFITLSLYNFHYFVLFIVPFIILYIEHATTRLGFPKSSKMSVDNMTSVLR